MTEYTFLRFNLLASDAEQHVERKLTCLSAKGWKVTHQSATSVQSSGGTIHEFVYFTLERVKP